MNLGRGCGRGVLILKNRITFAALLYQFSSVPMNIFVGSLPFRVGEEELGQLFSQYGEVSSARIIKDRATGRSKGYGFVEMPDDSAAQRAIEELDGSEMGGRRIAVNKAQEREARPRGGYGNRDNY